MVGDDPYNHAFGLMRRMLGMNKCIVKLIVFITKLLQPRMASTMVGLLGLGSVSELQQLVRDVSKFKQDVEEDLRQKGIDVLLAPAFAIPAPPVNQHRFCSGAASYTTTINVLDFPAGTIPVTTVSTEDIQQMDDYPTPDLWHKTAKKIMHGAEGLPVGVQVIGRPWQEETTLRIMKELETALKQ